MATLDRVRQLILDLAAERGDSLATLSCIVGRNPAYMHQYLDRGSPAVLPEYERRMLAIYFNIDERRLGARDPWTPGIATVAA